MQDLFATGHAIDLILALVCVEAIGLALLHRFGGIKIPVRLLVPNLLAGSFLLLAVRAALVDAGWIWVATALLAALVSHLADLTVRLSNRFAARDVPLSRTT